MTAVKPLLAAGLFLLGAGCASDLGLPVDAQLPFPRLGEVAAEEDEPKELKSRQETRRELERMDELAETHAEKAKQEIESRR